MTRDDEPSDQLNDIEAPKRYQLPRRPNVEISCSQAGYRFQLNHFRVFDFFFFSVRLSTNADEARFIAAQALAGGGDQKSVAAFEQVKLDRHPIFRKLQSFSEFQSEMMIIRSVDNFTAFLSETIQACMFRRPELLRSREQITTEDILRFTNRRELLDFLVNRKLNELSYGGLRGIEEFLDQRLNIALLQNENERATLSVAIELRNIYTHNRGVINELFLSRLTPHKHQYDFVLGKRYHADFDQIVVFANNLFDIAGRLDAVVVQKFGLKKKKYRTWDVPSLAKQ